MCYQNYRHFLYETTNQPFPISFHQAVDKFVWHNYYYYYSIQLYYCHAEEPTKQRGTNYMKLYYFYSIICMQTSMPDVT